MLEWNNVRLLEIFWWQTRSRTLFTPVFGSLGIKLHVRNPGYIFYAFMFTETKKSLAFFKLLITNSGPKGGTYTGGNNELVWLYRPTFFLNRGGNALWKGL